MIFSQTGSYGIANSENNSLKPLQVGDEAPEISTADFNLSKTLEDGPVVLIFYRGFWCPYCTRHLAKLEDELDSLHKLGAQIVAITPEGGQGADKTKNKTEWSSIIVRDEDKSIMQDYGVLFKVTQGYQLKINTFLLTNIANNNEDDEAFLPIPATYVIGRDGKVKYVHHDANYKNRVSMEEIVEVIEKL